jgi:hypothetical protein
MSPLERLLAEELPTGTFGDAPDTRTRVRPQPKARTRTVPDTAGYTVRNPISPEQAAANKQALADGIDGWEYDEPSRIASRHLYVVPTTAYPATTRSAA